MQNALLYALLQQTTEDQDAFDNLQTMQYKLSLLFHHPAAVINKAGS